MVIIEAIIIVVVGQFIGNVNEYYQIIKSLKNIANSNKSIGSYIIRIYNINKSSKFEINIITNIGV